MYFWKKKKLSFLKFCLYISHTNFGIFYKNQKNIWLLPTTKLTWYVCMCGLQQQNQQQYDKLMSLLQSIYAVAVFSVVVASATAARPLVVCLLSAALVDFCIFINCWDFRWFAVCKWFRNCYCFCCYSLLWNRQLVDIVRILCCCRVTIVIIVVVVVCGERWSRPA